MRSKKYPNQLLPSVKKFGLFSYLKPFSFYESNFPSEIVEIAKKYSLHLGSDKINALKYLFKNEYITETEADLLAKQLINWKSVVVDFEKNDIFVSTSFTTDHKDALIALIQDKDVRGIPIDKVVEEISLITCDQARRIANGLTREEAISNLPFSDPDLALDEAIDFDFSNPRAAIDNLIEKELRKLLDRLDLENCDPKPPASQKQFLIERIILLAIDLQYAGPDYTFIRMGLIHDVEAKWCLSIFKLLADKFPEASATIPNFNMICQKASEILDMEPAVSAAPPQFRP